MKLHADWNCMFMTLSTRHINTYIILISPHQKLSRKGTILSYTVNEKMDRRLAQGSCQLFAVQCNGKDAFHRIERLTYTLTSCMNLGTIHLCRPSVS